MENHQIKQPFNPNSFLTFIFSTQVLMTWCAFQGIFTGESYLLQGVFGLVCFPAYLIGGRMLAERGDDFSANLYYIFGTVFGGGMGAVCIVTFLDSIFGWGIEYTFMGVPMLLGGILLIPSMIPCLYLPWSECLTWVVVDIWMLVAGVQYFTGDYTLFLVSKWLCLASGLFVLYMSTSELMKTAGMSGLPAGKPIRSFPSGNQ